MSKLYKDEFLEEVKILYPDHKNLHADIIRDSIEDIEYIEWRLRYFLVKEGLDFCYLRDYIGSDSFDKKTLLEMINFQIRKEDLLRKFMHGDYFAGGENDA